MDREAHVVLLAQTGHEFAELARLEAIWPPNVLLARRDLIGNSDDKPHAETFREFKAFNRLRLVLHVNRTDRIRRHVVCAALSEKRPDVLVRRGERQVEILDAQVADAQLPNPVQHRVGIPDGLERIAGHSEPEPFANPERAPFRQHARRVVDGHVDERHARRMHDLRLRRERIDAARKQVDPHWFLERSSGIVKNGGTRLKRISWMVVNALVGRQRIDVRQHLALLVLPEHQHRRTVSRLPFAEEHRRVAVQERRLLQGRHCAVEEPHAVLNRIKGPLHRDDVMVLVRAQEPLAVELDAELAFDGGVEARIADVGDRKHRGVEPAPLVDEHPLKRELRL